MRNQEGWYTQEDLLSSCAISSNCRSRGEGGAAAAGLGGVGIDEVEALAHQGLLVVEDHAGEVEEALGVDEDAQGRGSACRRGADLGWLGGGLWPRGALSIQVRLGEGVDAVAV